MAYFSVLYKSPQPIKVGLSGPGLKLTRYDGFTWPTLRGRPDARVKKNFCLALLHEHLTTSQLY